MSNSSEPQQLPESRDLATYLGRRIRTLREASGLNRNQLAEKAGVHHTYLTELEDGAHGSPGLGILVRLVRGLELSSIEELTGGTAPLLLLSSESGENSPLS
jgi:transcriptional regulator with XRE-family HTH domain